MKVRSEDAMEESARTDRVLAPQPPSPQNLGLRYPHNYTMSGRLASFKGPSTPNASPVKQPKSSGKAPASPARPTESTYHRKVRTLLQELRTVTENWDDIVLVDGLKAAKSLVDARTELEYASHFSPLIWSTHRSPAMTLLRYLREHNHSIDWYNQRLSSWSSV